MGVGGQRHAPGRFTSGKDPIPTERAPWPVWMGVENLAPNGIRSQDRPALSKSLYRLRCPNLPRHHNIKQNYILRVPQWKNVWMKAGIFKYCALWCLIPYRLPSTQERWTTSKLHKMCQLASERNINFLAPFGNINPEDQQLYSWSHHKMLFVTINSKSISLTSGLILSARIWMSPKVHWPTQQNKFSNTHTTE